MGWTFPCFGSNQRYLLKKLRWISFLLWNLTLTDTIYMSSNLHQIKELFKISNFEIHNWVSQMPGFSVKVSFQEAIPSYSYSMDLLPILGLLFENLEQNKTKSFKDLKNSILIFTFHLCHFFFYTCSWWFSTRWSHQTFSCLHHLSVLSMSTQIVAGQDKMKWQDKSRKSLFRPTKELVETPL